MLEDATIAKKEPYFAFITSTFERLTHRMIFEHTIGFQNWKNLLIDMIHFISIIVIVIHTEAPFFIFVMTYIYFVISVVVFSVIFQDLNWLVIEVYLLWNMLWSCCCLRNEKEWNRALICTLWWPQNHNSLILVY